MHNFAYNKIEDFEENNDNEKEDSCTLKKNEIINNDYKRTVKFWKNWDVTFQKKSITIY